MTNSFNPEAHKYLSGSQKAINPKTLNDADLNAHIDGMRKADLPETNLQLQAFIAERDLRREH